MYPDLLFYYGIDLAKVIAGEGPAPSLVIALAERLPDTSMTAAIARGGRAYFGWGHERHMLADIYDALNLNTRATGNWEKGKAPTFDPWPRPGSTEELPAPPKRSVADIYSSFQRR